MDPHPELSKLPVVPAPAASPKTAPKRARNPTRPATGPAGEKKTKERKAQETGGKRKKAEEIKDEGVEEGQEEDKTEPEKKKPEKKKPRVPAPEPSAEHPEVVNDLLSSGKIPHTFGGRAMPKKGWGLEKYCRVAYMFATKLEPVIEPGTKNKAQAPCPKKSVCLSTHTCISGCNHETIVTTTCKRISSKYFKNRKQR